MSRRTLVVFDPHRALLKDGGFRDDEANLKDLVGFDTCLSANGGATCLEGSAIRLSLRTDAATSEYPDDEIFGDNVAPDVIHDMMTNFAKTELSEALLFLKNVVSVEFKEVDTDGTQRTIATASVLRQPITSLCSASMQVMDCTVTVTSFVLGAAKGIRNNWLLFHAIAESDVATKLSARLGYDVSRKLGKQKLRADVGLAFPASGDATMNNGRLFTFLPLPVHTTFPCHINALFALAPTRQHLVNGEETGMPLQSQQR